MKARPIVLVHPLGENWLPGAADITRIANLMPPHGLMMLAAVLERAGRACCIVDGYARPRPPAELVRDVLGLDPVAVGFSTTTSSFPGGYELAAALKAARPELPIVFGGVHPTSIWERLLAAYPAIDFVVVGEGEETLLELARADFERQASIPGLAVRRPSGEVVFGGPRPLLADLDSLPYPAYGKLVSYPAGYPLPLFNYPRAPGTTLIASRGCPFACSYCDRSVFGSSFRGHSPEYLVEHLAFLARRYRIRHVNIYDDNFLLRRERVAAFAELKLARAISVSFNCIGRAEHLDPELLRLMKRAGCWMINIGVESGDEELLAPHRAGAGVARAAETAAMIRAAGIRAKGLFMLGIPGETEATARKTVELAVTAGFDEANLTKFTPFPGAPIYETIREHGEFVEDWGRMNCMNFVFVPHGLTHARLEYWYQRFYRAFYGRPASAHKYLAMLWRSPDSWRRLLRHLPAFLAARKQLMQNSGAAGPPD